MKPSKIVVFLWSSLLVMFAHPMGAMAQLASTPPMGWDSWNHFALNISAQIIEDNALGMNQSGMQAAGYQYVVIDDGWQAPTRDGQGNLQPDPTKFPDGMEPVVTYVHNLGLKIGIYSSPGKTTCGGNLGSYGHEQQDAALFKSWGMDYLKYDWCSCQPSYCGSMKEGFSKMSNYLDHTQLVYKISGYGAQEPWKWAPEIGANMWGVGLDMQNDFYRMTVLSFVNDSGLGSFAGPTVANFGGVTNGGWNDPDMLEIGNGPAETTEEYITQMSIWTILAAPLIAGNDLRKGYMSKVTLDLLANPDITAVDQDPLGMQGYRVWQDGAEDIWIKPMSDGTTVVGVFNHVEGTDPIALPFAAIGISGQADAYDLWEHKDLGLISNGYKVPVLGHGARMLKLTPQQKR
jgi:alpha-galactosidase